MNKKRILIIVLVILAVAVAVGFLWQRGQRTENLTLYGNVDIREVDLSFRQAGRIVKLYVDEGNAVKQGQLLAELDAIPYEEALALAKANRAQSLASMMKARNGSRLQEIAQARAAVDQAKAALVEAEEELVRQTALQKTGATSLQSLQSARSGRDQAKANLDASRQEYSLRKEGFRKEDIAAAEATFAAAEAQLAQAETALGDTRLFAPADGLISARVREVGSMVATNSPVYTLSLQNPIYVRAYVSEAQLTRVQPGSTVTVRADGTNQRFKGTVGFISPKAEFTPKSVETTELRTDLVYRVRIVLPTAAAKRLRQGQPVTVIVDDGQRD